MELVAMTVTVRRRARFRNLSRMMPKMTLPRQLATPMTLRRRLLLAGERPQDLQLCYRDNEMTVLGYKFKYQHWWITDGTWTLEFGGGDVLDNNVNVHCIQDQRKTIIDSEFTKTQDVLQRMELVCGTTNYSLALRNCEHVARYIHCGSWICFQMVGRGILKGYFVDHMSHHTKLINTFPIELKPDAWKPEEINRQPAIYPEAPVHIKFVKTMEMMSAVDQNNFNIVILGPTGSGKSTLINNLFNKAVCQTGDSVHSVTKQVQFYQGTYSWKITTKNRLTKTVNIIDTLGFCDSVLSSSDVLNAIKGSVKVNMTYVDKIVIVCSGRIEKPHSDSIKQFMKWLNFKDYRDKFVFVYNKADTQNQQSKITNLLEMCSIFGADTNQTNGMMMKDGKRLALKMNLTTGFPPQASYDQVREDYLNFTRACLSAGVNGPNAHKRVPVDKSSCTIL